MQRSFGSGMPVPLEELLQHADWLRRLAGSLVSDPARADDLVQDTWLAALERPPLAGASPRPWLERVFRNLARNRGRSERARAEHESRAAERGPGPSSDAIAEEIEAQRVLAEAVARLSDPARTIVVLRYFRGLDSSAIGRELGLPAGTVRWKLKAALEELRRELDRRFEGGRKAWSLVLGRVAGSAAPAWPTATAGWLAIGTIAVAVVGLTWWSSRRHLDPGGASWTSATSGVGVEPAPRRGRSDDPAAEGGSPIQAPRSPIELLAAPGDPSDDEPDLRGTVLVDGVPAKAPIDLELLVHGRLPRRFVTDGQGRFELFAVGDVEASGTLGAPGYVVEDEESTVWWPAGILVPDRDLVLRLRTPPALRGRVVTAAGEPVGGASGTYALRTTVAGWQIESGRQELDCDEDGRFALSLGALMAQGMPKLGEGETCAGTLLFEIPGVGRNLLDLGDFPLAERELGDVVLEPIRRVRFLVRDEKGAPLSGAVARMEDHWLTRPSDPTNRDGRAELRHVPDRRIALRFSALGYADRVVPVDVGAEAEVWLEPVTRLEIQLEPPAGTYGAFPRITLRAREKLLEPALDPSQRPPELDLVFDPIQVQLGASANHGGWSSTKDASGLRVAFHYLPDAGGKAVITGIRSDVPFTVEACDSARKVLARRELVLAAGERKRIALPYGE